MQENGKQITLEDIDDLGGVIFYKDPDGQLYCFTLLNIKNILDYDTTINPLSGKPFTENFQTMIKKLNLDRVGGDGYTHPWHPSSQIAGEIFGDASDEYGTSDSDTSQDDDGVVVYQPFIGADVVLIDLTSPDGQKLNGMAGKINTYDMEKKRWGIKMDDGGTKKVKAENLQVTPTPQTIDNLTGEPIENNTTMSLKYGVGTDGTVLIAPSGLNGIEISKDESARSYEPIDQTFIDYIEKLITTMRETGHQFNFEAIEQDAKEAVKTQYCFGCSKRLSDDSKWSSTVLLNKQNGGFEKNTFHIKCLYDASFKI